MRRWARHGEVGGERRDQLVGVLHGKRRHAAVLAVQRLQGGEPGADACEGGGGQRGFAGERLEARHHRARRDLSLVAETDRLDGHGEISGKRGILI